MTTPFDKALASFPSDEAKQIDPGQSIQGHVSSTVKQEFEWSVCRPVCHPKLRIAAYEYIGKDQFGNEYVAYRAKLFDGADYDVHPLGERGWVRPSLIRRFGGWNAGLVDFLRETAFRKFAEINLAILKARSLTNPIAIEPKDALDRRAEALTKAVVGANESPADHPGPQIQILNSAGQPLQGSTTNEQGIHDRRAKAGRTDTPGAFGSDRRNPKRHDRHGRERAQLPPTPGAGQSLG